MADQAITLREHLEELRKRLLISVVAVVVAAIVAFVFRTQLLNFLLEPAQGFGNSLTGKPVFTGVTEMLGVVMKTSIMAGVVFALPVVLYQLVMFVAPGLNRREKTYLFIFLPATVVAFASGVLFGYYVLFPPAHAVSLHLRHRGGGPHDPHRQTTWTSSRHCSSGWGSSSSCRWCSSFWPGWGW